MIRRVRFNVGDVSSFKTFRFILQFQSHLWFYLTTKKFLQFIYNHVTHKIMHNLRQRIKCFVFKTFLLSFTDVNTHFSTAQRVKRDNELTSLNKEFKQYDS